MHFSAALLAPLALAAGAAAHGYLGSITIDGKAYKGNGDGGDPATTVIRPTKPYDVGPVKGADNPDIVCGLSPVQNAALQADAKPGSTVQVLWVGQGGTHWIHEVGPVMHYMAECTGVPDCSTFNPADAVWSKIDEKGLKADGSTWYMADIYNGQPVSFTIPQGLKAGNYLLRSELIALHNAASVGGAEFYPNCAQLKVGGSGTGKLSPTVSFPGAYSDTDPGIVVPDIYNPGFTYDFPGGPVATIGGAANVAPPAHPASAHPSPASSGHSASATPSVHKSAPAPAATPAPGGAATTSSSSNSTSPYSGQCRGKTNSMRRRRSAGAAGAAAHSRRNGIRQGHAAAHARMFSHGAASAF